MAPGNLNFKNSSFWDKVWEDAAEGSPHGGGTTLLLTVLEGLSPGRALDVGCGDGSNGILMSEQGWRVTAVDFSPKALESGRRKAIEANVVVEFVLADVAGYVPEGRYDLVTSFYIQLPPEVRATMLSNLCDALAPGGKLLFLSHDRSTPLPGWSEADNLTLTSVETVVSELHGVEIEFASVLGDREMAGNDVNDHDRHIQGLNSTVIVGKARLPGQQTPSAHR